MDRFVAMQAFARVVETGSFTKAADTLHLSKTSVTQLVQQLEARLRVKLLNRTTRKVNVTADGAAYYERVVRLLADLDDAETGLSSASTSPRGRLRVDVPSPFARSILIPALPTFHARYPEIQLDLGVSDRMVDLINENVDCVVRGGELTDLSLMARHIGDGKVFPYAIHRDGERVSVMGRYVLSVDDGNAYLAAGLAGLGVLWLPDYLSHAHLENGDLAPLFEDWRLEPMPLYLAFPPNRHVSVKVRVFIDWIAELMAQQAPVARQERA